MLHVTSVASTAEVFLRPHFERQRLDGWDVHLACSPSTTGARPFVGEDVNLHEISIERRLSPAEDVKAIARMVRLIVKVRPSIVHLHSPKASMVGVVACRLVPGTMKSIYHMHGLRSDSGGAKLICPVRWAERLTALLADEIICVSPSLQKRAADLGVLRRGSGVVLANGSISGIDSEVRFAPSKDGSRRCDIRRELGIAEDAIVLGFVGRLAADKGLDDLYDVFCELRRRRDQPTMLLLVGEIDSSDPARGGLVAEMQDDSDVLLVGFQRAIESQYPAMDLLVSASCREGMPVSILEAAAMEVPCVGYSVTGVVDAIEDQVTGRLVPYGDKAALVDAIESVGNRLTLGQMGRSARERVSEEFSEKAAVDALVEFYGLILRRLRDPARVRGHESDRLPAMLGSLVNWRSRSRQIPES